MAHLRSINLGSRTRFNIGKRSVSITGYSNFARLTVGTERTTGTIKIPGTGLRQMTSFSNMEKEYSSREEAYEDLSYEYSQENNNYLEFLNLVKTSPTLFTNKDFEKQLEFREFDPKSYNLSYPSGKKYISDFLKDNPTKFKGVLFWLSISLGSLSILVPEGTFGLICFILGLVLFGVNCFTFYKRRKEKRDLAIQKLNQQKQKIEVVRGLHPQNEFNRIETLKKVYANEEQWLPKQIDETLLRFSEMGENAAHKFQVKTSFKWDNLGLLSLDIELPELSAVIPVVTKKALKSGRPSIKPKNPRLVGKEYDAAVLGIAFNLTANLFNLSPKIQLIKVEGQSRVTEGPIGDKGKKLYNIYFDRKTFGEIHFQVVDVLKELKKFKHSFKSEKIKEPMQLSIKKSA